MNKYKGLISVKQFIYLECAFCRGEITDEVWTVTIGKTQHTMCRDCASTIDELFNDEVKGNGS